MMDIVLTGLKWKTCLIYLYGAVVFSKSFDNHLSDLDDVLTARKKAGLRLKKSKWQIGVTTLQMLGHLVDQQGVRPNPEKVPQSSPERCEICPEFLPTMLILSEIYS